MKNIKLFLVSLLGLGATLALWAGVPHSIVYTGRIVDVNNPVLPAPATKTMTFTLKNETGFVVWSAKDVSVLVETNGLFTVELKDGMTGAGDNEETLRDLFVAGVPKKIAVTVDGEEIFPEQALSTTPFVDRAAAVSRQAEGASMTVTDVLKVDTVSARGKVDVANATISNLKGNTNAELTLGAVDMSGVTGLTLKKPSDDSGEVRFFRRGDPIVKRGVIFSKDGNSGGIFNTPFVSRTNPNAIFYDPKWPSGILVVMGSGNSHNNWIIPAVVLPFTGEDIKWELNFTESQNFYCILDLLFYPFGL